MASSDGHYGYPGHGWVWGFTALDSTSRGTGLTGIYAEELTREAIFDALEARRVFATTDHRTILDFRINGARMGSEISSDSIPVIQGSVFSLTPIDTVELVKYDDRGYRIEQLIADHSTRRYEFSMVDTLFDRDSFYYLRVVSEGNLNNRFAWSSPIWVNKHIHQSPIISALPELTILEDDSLTIQVCDWYSCVEDADTPDSLLTWVITSRNTHIDIQKDIRPYNFVICADPDWWGVDTLTVIVSDEKRWDSTRLALHVLPVNDPPEPFGLVSPVDSCMIHIPIGELRRRSIKLEWESSIDIESDEFWYYAKLTSPDGNMVRSPDIFYPGCIISLSGLWEEPRALDGAQHLSWNVAAMDGEDTSWSADGPYTLIIQTGALEVLNTTSIPEEYMLHNNYPNPFNYGTIIPYDVPRTESIRLAIYDVLGREVILLEAGRVDPGYRQVFWEGRDQNGDEVSSGIYIARLVTPNYHKSIKLVLMK
ncbi:T9SS type A sorting domain-containing protein [Candidatus Neomarinimicrobiota bacterium]